jgi:hypothetical protein
VVTALSYRGARADTPPAEISVGTGRRRLRAERCTSLALTFDDGAFVVELPFWLLHMPVLANLWFFLVASA